MIQEIIIDKNMVTRTRLAKNSTQHWSTIDMPNMLDKPISKASDFSILIRNSQFGARQAMNGLLREADQGAYKNVENIEMFQEAKKYFIFSTEKHTSLERLQETMIYCNMNRISSKTVGCLVLGEDTYVFFWLKSA